ncbi:MAG: trypsin-like peptidase domain-containing protein [Oscillospiraceae bacterium]|nr:trypsin-like peptidase domain-containing protein [Oscillospiraceae bacterium]
MSEHTEYNSYYTPPTPPPKKSGGAWKIIVAVAASLLVFAFVICSTAIFITWLTRTEVFNTVTEPTESTLTSEATTNEPALSYSEQTTIATEAPATEATLPTPTTIQTNTTVSGEALSVPEIYSENVDSVVSIVVKGVATNGWQQYPFSASGSGFIVSEDGYIITCLHVVEGANEIKVSLFNGTEYDAEYVGGDKLYDVAVLKIDAEGLRTVALGDSDNLIIGEDAIVIGNPLSLTFSVTKGIISATDRVIDVDENDTISVFQLDAAVNSGNSGGPVFNSRGEVIGLVDAKYAAEGVEGLGFAVPINQVMDVAEDLISYGYVTGRPYFGITASTASVARGFAVDGARIESVDPDSCSAAAGLKVGDIIIAIDGRTVTSASDLISEKNNYKAGDTAELTVWRTGEALTLPITFDEAK